MSSLEELRARVRPWTEPIAPESPGGRSMRNDPAYEAVAAEIAKLESPTAGQVRWDDVVRQSSDLLQHATKDLWLAAYLAHGLYALEGLKGAATGLLLLAELSERYWPSMFPEAARLRSRVNAVAWFVDRMTAALPALPPSGTEAEAVDALAAAVEHLAAVSRQRFEAQAPPLGALAEAIQRRRALLAAGAEVQAPPPEDPDFPAPPPPPSGHAAPVRPQLRAGKPGPTPNQRRAIATAMQEAAATLRRANPADPAPYRLARAALGCFLERPPAAEEGGARTQVPPLPGDLRVQLDGLEKEQRWAEALELAESRLGKHPYALDLQRCAAAALAGLGPACAPAREAVLQELGALLRRLPRLMELAAADGTPLCDARTRKWIDAEVLPVPTLGPPPPPAPSDAGAGEDGRARVEAEARELLSSGKHQEALAVLERAVDAAPTGRARFLARIALARLCGGVGQLTLARNLYEALDREAAALVLDEWEPAIAASCLEGWLTAAHSFYRGTAGAPPEFWGRYQRLARLQPSAALRLRI